MKGHDRIAPADLDDDLARRTAEVLRLLKQASRVASAGAIRASDFARCGRLGPVPSQVSTALRLAGLKVRCSTIELTPRN
jgi:hypothetical protein